ncbi:hypothetical protein [Stenotrophobium rhamnosiphilum]|uniref:Alginate export domain-containing protein n=1 Tax=Stenotrophobium rhamnosiphilum TaxID=2029166 RepID=A0A2T5MEN8_9GAMM|nr:hypothetical protein [Stenotrophobium rhamnosiphilum]PTU31027.1 hypothetical protein CJD38_12065 [Stenotrophobium rhamnosiphilum]
MKKSLGYAFCTAATMLTSGAAMADSIDVLRYALSGGTPNLDVRGRWEHVSQDNALDAADAYTVRARVGYTTGRWNDLDVQTEFEGTFPFGPQAYNSTTNGKVTRSTIGDPKGTELNQVSLRYTGIAGNVFKLGRQRFILDNARFIGNSGWRQNEVTFDAFTAVNTKISKTTLTYAYLSRVDDKNYKGFKVNGQVFNAAYAASTQLNLVGYAYLFDFDQNLATRRDTQTYGLRANGAFPFDGFKLLYTAEYAHQNHYKDSPSAVSAQYILAELGASSHGVSAKLGYEVLGGDGTYGFQTPLATLHVFQGWADQFLNTPTGGIRDAYLKLEGDAPAGIKLLGFYHDFRSDNGGAKYGTEYDVQAMKAINDNFSVTAKYAGYRADTFSVNADKYWLQAEYKF